MRIGVYDRQPRSATVWAATFALRTVKPTGLTVTSFGANVVDLHSNMEIDLATVRSVLDRGLFGPRYVWIRNEEVKSHDDRRKSSGSRTR